MHSDAREQLMEDRKSAQRRQALNELRFLLKDVLKPHHDDQKLTKFLVARKYNVKAAAEMLRKHLISADFVGLDHILVDYIPPKKSLYFPSAVLGFHKNGCIVRLLSFVNVDIKGMSLSHTPTDAAKYASYLMESDKRKQKLRFQETGEGGDDKHMYILDLKDLPWNLAFHRPTIQLMIFLLRRYEENYPESLKHAYAVNVPSFFSIVYGIVKSVIPADILRKVDVVNSDRCGAVLREAFGPEMIPASLGGTRTDPDGDPSCPSLFDMKPGTKVPRDYYLINTLPQDPKAKKTTIMNSSTLRIPLDIDAPCVLFWYYTTMEHDIGMSVYFRRTGQMNAKCVVPPTRVNSHRIVESGFHPFEETGSCEVVFDNSYSWWTKKTLIYKLELVKAGEEAESILSEV